MTKLTSRTTHCAFFSLHFIRFTVMDVLDEYVDNELYLGFRDLFNTTRKDCVWRNAYKDRKLCAKDVKIWLYSNGSEELVILIIIYRKGE